jgi:epoxide hydrolase-like predicted phosphatase
MVKEAQRRLSLSPEQWEEFQAERRKSQTWDTELLAFIRNLRPRYKTGVISNGSPGTREWAAEYVNGDTFDAIVFSDEEGVAKPDPEIYRQALSRLGVAAEETIYVDDLLPNVKAARSLGIHAIYHTGSTKVQDAVNHLLPPQLPGS